MTKWLKVAPDADGWLWIKFRGKHGTVKKPAELTTLGDKTRHLNCSGTLWIDWGKGFTYVAQIDKSLRFGPSIEEPK